MEDTKIKVEYKLIRNGKEEGKTIEVNKNIYFVELINEITGKKEEEELTINIKGLKTITWGKKVSEMLLRDIKIYDFSYKTMNYKIEYLQKFFKLFNQELIIQIIECGIGVAAGEAEGINFKINTNEKDRHEHQPHVHCEYSGEKMRIRIDTCEIMNNDKEFKTKSKTKKAIEYVCENKDELLKLYIELNKIKGESIQLELNI